MTEKLSPEEVVAKLMMAARDPDVLDAAEKEAAAAGAAAAAAAAAGAGAGGSAAAAAASAAAGAGERRKAGRDAAQLR